MGQSPLGRQLVGAGRNREATTLILMPAAAAAAPRRGKRSASAVDAHARAAIAGQRVGAAGGVPFSFLLVGEEAQLGRGVSTSIPSTPRGDAAARDRSGGLL